MYTTYREVMYQSPEHFKCHLELQLIVFTVLEDFTTYTITTRDRRTKSMQDRNVNKTSFKEWVYTDSGPSITEEDW